MFKQLEYGNLSELSSVFDFARSVLTTHEKSFEEIPRVDAFLSNAVLNGEF